MTILDRFRLDGRTAIVTGASSGLGVSFSRACAEAGARVAIAARQRVDRLQEVASDLRKEGHDILVFPTDVSDPAQCQNLVARVMAETGRVDVLVNNAGIGDAIPAIRETPEQFRHIVDINLHGCYWLAQACGRVMTPCSSVINVSSILGLTTAGLPQAAYSASKAGLLGLTRDLAQQWGVRRGIRVNALAPGFFSTEMTDDLPAGYLDGLQHRMLLPRLGDPEELAASLVWLASDASGYVTGQTIIVDGGMTIT